MKRDLHLIYQHLSFLSVSCRHLHVFTNISRQNQTLGGKENMPAVQVKVSYILKHFEDRKALSVRIYCTCCDIILIFKLHKRTRLTPRSSIHSLKIRMTSHPCNKYEQLMLSYLQSVKYQLISKLAHYFYVIHWGRNVQQHSGIFFIG